MAIPGRALHIERRSFTQPPWQGEPLEGRPILLYAEEGFGDTLQFARYVPLVAERGGRVILDVQPGLRRLLRNLPGVAHCMAQAGEAMPAFAVHASLMSLPYLFRTTLDSIPPPVLSPEWPGLVLQPASKEGPLRVGLVWAGNPKHQRDSVRSIPLEQWRPLASIEGVSFTSLQKGPGELQIEEHGACFDFIGDSSRIKDFVDTAAVIVDLDLVITVDSAVAHLAGTMGKPVWILLDNTRDWRWGLESNKTPWYPSARLFRQTVPTDWRGVIEEVAAALAEQSARKSEAAAGG